MRSGLRDAAGALLTPQASTSGGPAWDVFQIASAGRRTVVVAAFDRVAGERDITVRPVGLRPQSTYRVQSVDAGDLGAATGAELMADGISIFGSPNTAAHLLILTRQ
jgi:hypothetical protein